MSGRNNPSPDYPPPTIACDDLVLDVVLLDVDENLAGGLKVGDKLSVELVEGRYPAPMVAEKPLGSIASGTIGRLQACLRDGVRFEAEIIEIEGAYVRVRVAAT